MELLLLFGVYLCYIIYINVNLKSKNITNQKNKTMTSIEKINIIRIFIYILILVGLFVIKALVENNIDEKNIEERKKDLFSSL